MSNAFSRVLLATVGVAGSAFFVTACGRGHTKPSSSEQASVGSTTITSADLRASVDSAAERIATAHCAQEKSCSRQISAPLTEASIDACQQNAHTATAARLDPKACPLGVNPTKLADCVAAVEGAGCYNVMDMYTRSAECRASTLCYQPNE